MSDFGNAIVPHENAYKGLYIGAKALAIASFTFTALIGARLIAAQFSKGQLLATQLGLGQLSLRRGTIYLIGGGAGLMGFDLLAQYGKISAQGSYKVGHHMRRKGGDWVTGLAKAATLFALTNGIRLIAAHYGHGTLPLKLGLIYIGGGIAAAAALSVAGKKLSE